MKNHLTTLGLMASFAFTGCQQQRAPECPVQPAQAEISATPIQESVVSRVRKEVDSAVAPDREQGVYSENPKSTEEEDPLAYQHGTAGLKCGSVQLSVDSLPHAKKRKTDCLLVHQLRTLLNEKGHAKLEILNQSFDQEWEALSAQSLYESGEELQRQKRESNQFSSDEKNYGKIRAKRLRDAKDGIADFNSMVEAFLDRRERTKKSLLDNPEYIAAPPEGTVVCFDGRCFTAESEIGDK